MLKLRLMIERAVAWNIPEILELFGNIRLCDRIRLDRPPRRLWKLRELFSGLTIEWVVVEGISKLLERFGKIEFRVRVRLDRSIPERPI